MEIYINRCELKAYCYCGSPSIFVNYQRKKYANRGLYELLNVFLQKTHGCQNFFFPLFKGSVLGGTNYKSGAEECAQIEI